MTVAAGTFGHAAVRAERRRKGLLSVLGLTLVLTVIGGLSLRLGLVPVDLRDITGSFAGGERSVVVDLRFARFAVAAAVGAGLAISGTLMQAILRNPLVEPGVLGLNAGAALAAATVLMLTTGAVPQSWLAAAAIIGAICVMVLILGLAWRPGRHSPDRLILVGIAISALCAALLSALTLSGPPQRLPRLLSWLAGDLNGMTIAQTLLLAVMLVSAVPLVFWLHRKLDILALDRLSAAGLGLRAVWPIYVSLLLAALLAGFATSVAGIIAFVGLISPHMARQMVGPAHGWLVPVAALLGACIVSTADLTGRLVLMPDQLPAGLICTLIGAPYFFYLMSRRHV